MPSGAEAPYRPGRLLTGWLDAAAATAMGPNAAEAWRRYAERRPTVRATRAPSPEASVAQYQSERVQQLSDLDESLRREGWTAVVVDLEQLHVSQSSVAIDDPRAVGLSSNSDIEEVAEISLPLQSTYVPTTAFDERANAWVIRSRLATAQIVGRYSGGFDATDDQTQGFGFLVSAQPSRMSALEIDGQLVLFDGHHRAAALWSVGVRHVPCLIRRGDVSQFREVGTLSVSVLLSRDGPRVPDYFDDAVSEPLGIARSERVIVISASEYQLPT